MTAVTEFGKQLLRTGDLDPVYVAVHKTDLKGPTLARLCLAYWCFYHLGLAARLAEAKTDKAFWEGMQTAALNVTNADGTKPYPRGSERRHYRGEQAVASMASLISMYGKGGAEAAVEGFIQPNAQGQYTYGSVAKSAQNHRGFGEWIAFKIADMSERLLGYDTDFSDCHLGIYKDPRQGAAVAYLEWDHEAARYHEGAVGLDYKPWGYPISNDQLESTVAHYVKVFRKMKLRAPPTGDRLVNVQEVETIFCKYKSHLKGHYPLGKDTLEIGHGLTGWGDLAQQLKAGLP